MQSLDELNVRIGELEKNLAFRKSQLEEWQKRKITEGGKPQPREKKLIECDEQIEETEARIKAISFNMEQLEKQRPEFEKKDRMEMAMLDDMPRISEMQKLSKLLHKQLEAAEETNQKLRAKIRAVDNVKRDSGKTIALPGISKGSRYLGTIAREIGRETSGEGRKVFKWPNWKPI